MEEFETISAMLEAAEREGLLVEVVWTFGNLRNSGDNVEDASKSALYEWDI
jgi:hypothetical protein